MTTPRHPNRRRRRHGQDPCSRPVLSIPLILAWADAHFQRMGTWPRRTSGLIPQAPGVLTWRAVEMALQVGRHGLAGGNSLPRVLAEHRGVRNHMNLPHLSKARILLWADAHHERTGQWPTCRSGPIAAAPGET
jgi:hypothetical protein